MDETSTVRGDHQPFLQVFSAVFTLAVFGAFLVLVATGPAGSTTPLFDFVMGVVLLVLVGWVAWAVRLWLVARSASR